MEGHHEVWKSLSRWHLLKKRVVSLVITLCSKRLSALEVKMGHVRQDKPVGKSGITLVEKNSGVVSYRPFPILQRGQNARYSKCFQTY